MAIAIKNGHILTAVGGICTNCCGGGTSPCESCGYGLTYTLNTNDIDGIWDPEPAVDLVLTWRGVNANGLCVWSEWEQLPGPTWAWMIIYDSGVGVLQTAYDDDINGENFPIGRADGNWPCNSITGTYYDVLFGNNTAEVT